MSKMLKKVEEGNEGTKSTWVRVKTTTTQAPSERLNSARERQIIKVIKTLG